MERIISKPNWCRGITGSGATGGRNGLVKTISAAIFTRRRHCLATTKGHAVTSSGVLAARPSAAGPSPWCKGLISGSLRRRGLAAGNGQGRAISR